MYFTMSSFQILFSSILFTCALSQTCHLRELDMCTATIIVYTHNPSGIATSESELNEQCAQLKSAEMCVRNYTRKCMTAMQQELIAFATENTYQSINNYCTPGSPVRRNFLKNSAACWSRGASEQRNCVRDFNVALRSTSNSGREDNVQTACCAYKRFLDCTQTSLEQRCNKNTIDFMHVLLKMALSYLPDIMCRGYQNETGNQACRGIEFNDPQGASKENGPLSKYFSAYTGLN